MLPGGTLAEKFILARRYGYDGIELQIAGDGRFLARRDELCTASRAGVVMPSACFNTHHFIGSVVPEERRRAIQEMKQVIAVLGAVGVPGVVTPNGCEIGSKYLARLRPTLSDAQATDLLIEGLREVARSAEDNGVLIYLEPLNRYEDYVVNTIDQALRVIAEVGSEAVAVCGDTYHMSLEEKSIEAAIRGAGDRLGHIQLGDSQRSEPGGGHYDWPTTLHALRSIEFSGWLALECFLSGPADQTLAPAAALLRRIDAVASPTMSRPDS
ncbi:MAG: sugar phosphate isomerase/epimerase family protein [Arachnia sp.]